METLAWVAATSVFSAMALLGFHIAADRFASRKLKKLELIPNCLLTRYPLVFISGRRSVFYFLNYWNQIPSFLAEHGYDVEVIELPWRGAEARLNALRAAIAGRKTPCHLFGDSSIEEELRTASEWGFRQIMSVTVVESEDRTVRGRVAAQDLRPRNDGLMTLHLPQPPARFNSGSLGAWGQALLLGLHNLLEDQAPVVGMEIGLCLSAEPWHVERKFLEFAISLAERDAR